MSNGSIAHVWELEDHPGGNTPSAMVPSLLQHPDFLEGDALRRRGLRVGGRRLRLVSAGWASGTWTGTAR